MTSQDAKLLKIGIIAGEHSGDTLASQLMQAILEKYPNTQFFGISGKKMRDIGIESYADVEELSVMGLFEVVKHLPRLLKLKKKVSQALIDAQIDVFIGVDYQEFNHSVAATLKANNVKTIQYVGPSIWGWRENRVFKIKKILDHLLLLLPFEKAIYDRHHIGATYVGHPLAHNLSVEVDKSAARQALALKNDDVAQGQLVAILPGSRSSEIELLLPVFLNAASQYLQARPDTKFVIPAVSPAKAKAITAIVQKQNASLPLEITIGNASQVLQAAQFVFIASGTATLEAMLCKTPMLVAYRMNAVTAWILRRLVTAKYMALPNLLADKLLVPEFKQDEVEADKLAETALDIMSTEKAAVQVEVFTQLHKSIKQPSSQLAAEAVLKVANVDAS